MAQTGRDKNVHRGDFGGFAVTLQRRFDRSNTPYDSYYGDSVAGWQQHYSLEPELAAAWRAARGLPEPLPTMPGREEMDHHADS